jgi:hypothetical protein
MDSRASRQRKLRAIDAKERRAYDNFQAGVLTSVQLAAIIAKLSSDRMGVASEGSVSAPIRQR